MAGPWEQFAEPVSAGGEFGHSGPLQPGATPGTVATPFGDVPDPAVAPAAAGPWTQFAAPEAAAPEAAAVPAKAVRPVGQRGMPQVGLTAPESASLNTSFDRSLRDVIDKPAEWMARGSDYIGLTSGEGDRVAGMNADARQAYDAKYGADPLAQVGRLGGQVALTLPLGGAIGKVAGAAGEAAAAGMGEAAPAVGRAAQGVADFVGGTAGGAGAGNRVLQAGSVATNSAAQGATAAALTAGQSDAPVQNQMATGAMVGAAVGPVLRGAAAGIGAAKTALSGGEMNPEVARLGALARDKYGINLTYDQVSPSPFVQILGSQLRQVPGSGMAPAQAGLQSQFTKAISKTIGEDAEQITPTVMERAATRIGGIMDDVASRTTIRVDKPFMDGLSQIENDAAMLTPDQFHVIRGQLQNVLGAVREGDVITGAQYQSLTKMNSPLGKAMRSGDSDVRNAAIDIRHTLDDTLERSLPEGSPLLAQLRDARLQYKNLKTIEPLVVRGEPGEISPVALQGQVNRSFKGRGMKEQQPELGEIADIGRQFNLRPDSGTAGRTMITAGLGAAGGLATSLFTNPMNALYSAGAAGAGIGAGRMAGNMLRNPARINSLLEIAAKDATAPAASTNPLLPYAVPVATIGQGRLTGR